MLKALLPCLADGIIGKCWEIGIIDINRGPNCLSIQSGATVTLGLKDVTNAGT